MPAPLISLPEEILTAKDPLKTLLDQHSKDADQDRKISREQCFTQNFS